MQVPNAAKQIIRSADLKQIYLFFFWIFIAYKSIWTGAGKRSANDNVNTLHPKADIMAFELSISMKLQKMLFSNEWYCPIRS